MNTEPRFILSGQPETVVRTVCRIVAGLCLFGAFSAALGAPIAVKSDAVAAENAGETAGDAAPAQAKKAAVVRTQAKLPMHFEKNDGQFHDSVKYGTRGKGYQLFLNGKETILTLHKPAAVPPDAKARTDPRRGSRLAQLRGRSAAPEVSTVIRKSFAGANPNAEVTGVGPLPGKSHYMIGKDPRQWRMNVSHYAGVRLANVYPGIDLVYYGSEGRLEYDWIVAPGADPHRIVETFGGASGVRIARNGDLIVDSQGGPIWQKKPVVYQEIKGERVAVDGRYVTLGDNSVGFKVGRYDRSVPLVIDPVLVYSTYLGGSFGGDNGRAIAVNAAGEAYIAGVTRSPDFPHAQAPSQLPVDQNGFVRIPPWSFVTKLNAAGDGIVYSTYFGGTVFDPDLPVFAFGLGGANGIALGADGSAYVTGSTFTSDFPATVAIATGTHNPTLASTYVVKLAPGGDAMSYSTLIAGDGNANGTSIAVDASGSAIVAGGVDGTVFPTTPGAFQTAKSTAGTEGFVAKLMPNGSALSYSTLFGGVADGGDFNDISALTTIKGMAVDATGNVHITGPTTTPFLPLANAIRGVFNGSLDGYFAKIDPSGSSLVYSTYYGGVFNGLTAGPFSASPFNAIAIDSRDNALITGGTLDGFPLVNPLPSQVGTSVGGAVLVKIDPSGAVLLSTTIGAPDDQDSVGNGIAVDRLDNIYVTGATSSLTAFPLVGDLGLGGAPNPAAPTGRLDAFVMKLSSDGSSIGFSVKVGGDNTQLHSTDIFNSGMDVGNAVAVDSLGGVYVVGHTLSTDFPTFNAIQPDPSGTNNVEFSTIAGSSDVDLDGEAFVVKLFEGIGDIGVFSSQNPSVAGQEVTFTATVPGTSPTGTVTFFDGASALGTVAVASGVAKLAVSTLPIASHSITARYSGDASHPVGASALLTQDVLDANAQRQNTSVTLTAVGNPDRSVTLTATVTGANPTGAVIFLDNLGSRTVFLNSGTASVRLASLTEGSHTITARYVGDLHNNPSTSAPVTFLSGPPAVSITSPVDGSLLSAPANLTVTATVTAQIGATVASVKFLLNGAPLATLTTPPYTFPFPNAPPGIYTFSVQATDSLGQVSAPSSVQVRVYDPGVTFFHQDLQGNVVAASDGLGQITYSENYRPYGARLVNSPASQVAQINGNRLWFHGKAQDESTGLQYFGARYYDPAIGTFMGVDSVGFDENNIHSFNRYAYGNNNPYRYADPNGKDAIEINCCILGIGVTFGIDDGSNQPFFKFRAGMVGAGLYAYPDYDFAPGVDIRHGERAEIQSGEWGLGVSAGVGGLQAKGELFTIQQQHVNVEHANGEVTTHSSENSSYLTGPLKSGIEKDIGTKDNKNKDKSKRRTGAKLDFNGYGEIGKLYRWSDMPWKSNGDSN